MFSRSSLVASWKRIYNSLNVATTHIKSSFRRLTPLYSFVLLQFSFCTSTTTESESYVATDGESASLSWNKTPIYGLRPDFCYCQSVAGLLMWGALSEERTGLSFTIAAGPRKRSYSRVRVPWDSQPYITVSDSRLPFLSLSTTRWAKLLSLSLILRPTFSRPVCLAIKHPSGTYDHSCGFVDLGRSLWREDGSLIYNCCWRSPTPYFSVSDSRLPFSSPPTTRRARWRYSTPPPHGILTKLHYWVRVSYFTIGGLLPISSSWRQAPSDSRPDFFQLNTCGHSPYVTSSLTRGWVCRLQLLLALASAFIISSESRRTHYHILLSQIRDSPNWNPGPRIYIPQEQGGSVITPGTWFSFRRFHDSQGYGGGNSNPLSHPGGPVCYALTHKFKADLIKKT
jgi:hypothetical protein